MATNTNINGVVPQGFTPSNITQSNWGLGQFPVGFDPAMIPKAGLVDFKDIKDNLPEWQTRNLNFDNNPQATVNANAIGKANSIYDQATTGTLNSFNTAANRLRERITSMNRGQQNQINQKFLGTGFGASGLNNNAKISQNLGSQNVYAQGLNELSNTFEQNRLNGLGIGQGAVNSLFGDQQTADKLNLDSWDKQSKYKSEQTNFLDTLNSKALGEASTNYTNFLQNWYAAYAQYQAAKENNA